MLLTASKRISYRPKTETVTEQQGGVTMQGRFWLFKQGTLPALKHLELNVWPWLCYSRIGGKMTMYDG